MKVVQINATFGFSSTGIIVKDLHTLSRSHGIESYVAYSKGNTVDPFAFRVGNIISNKLHALFSRMYGKQGYYSAIATYKLLNKLEQISPDIIHIHDLHACYINLPMLLKYIAKRHINLVVTLHDCWYYTGGCFHYTSVGCRKFLLDCSECPKRYIDTPAYIKSCSSKILKERKKMFSLIESKYIVGVSKWISDEAKEGLFKNSNCRYIHNGVDVEFFHFVGKEMRKKIGIKTNNVILAPANKWYLEENKDNFNYLISHLPLDTTLVMFGAAQYPEVHNENLIHYGFVSSRDEIRSLYSMADVMINSTYEESLSLLNLECQACGTPVVTFGNTGVKETVDNVCGFTVSNNDVKTMLDKVVMILAKGRSHYAGACQDWIDKNFNKNRNYMEYIRLYKEIVCDL